MTKRGNQGSRAIHARPLDHPGVDEPIDALGEGVRNNPDRSVRRQLDELRGRIAELETEIDAIATEAHTAVGTVPGADRLETAKDVVAEKRDEIQRLKSRLQEIERSLAVE